MYLPLCGGELTELSSTRCRESCAEAGFEGLVKAKSLVIDGLRRKKIGDGALRAEVME